MVIIEFFAIISALIMESIILQTGSIKVLSNWLTKDKTAKFLHLRIFTAFLVWTGSLLYILFGISWCFSSVPPIQFAGIALITLSGISVIGKYAAGWEKPMWYIQLDSCLSIVCVFIVAVSRIKGA